MEKTYRMKNLDCANCAAKIERAVKKINGVKEVNINFMTQRLSLVTDTDNQDAIMPDVAAIIRKIEPDTELVF